MRITKMTRHAPFGDAPSSIDLMPNDHGRGVHFHGCGGCVLRCRLLVFTWDLTVPARTITNRAVRFMVRHGEQFPRTACRWLALALQNELESMACDAADS